MTGKKLEPTYQTFIPRNYLTQYYSGVDLENEELLKFFVDCYKSINSNQILLEFGGGPTIYSLITAATKVKEIHFCDFVPANLDEIRLWKEGHPNSFNWTPFIKKALEIENGRAVTNREIRERESLIRSKLTMLLPCDAFSSDPLGKENRKSYDILQVNFVPESITSSHNSWKKALINIVSLLKSNGTLLLTALHRATYYHVQEKAFEAFKIESVDMLIKVLEEVGFTQTNTVLRTISANPPFRGYEGFIFVYAKRID